MKLAVTRFKCDAPDCKHQVDIEGLPQTPTTVISTNPPLPEGWIEFSVTGATPGGQPALVHASTSECARKLAEAQVDLATEVAETERKAEEERQRQAEKDRKEAEKEVEKRAKEEAKRAAEAAEEEKVAAEKKAADEAAAETAGSKSAGAAKKK